MARKIENKFEQNKDLKHDKAEQRKNALKFIVFVFVLPMVAVAVSLATR